MRKISYIEYKSGKRELLYGRKIPRNAENVVIETVTDEEYKKVQELPMEDVKIMIDNILDYKS